MTRITKENPMRLCVFCGSSSGQDPIYLETARALGETMAAQGIEWSMAATPLA